MSMAAEEHQPEVIWTGKRFEWTGGYYTKHIPKGAKWLWSKRDKVWWTDIFEKAAELVDYAEGEAHQMLDHWITNSMEQHDASRATSADIDVPAPEGCVYMPFQLAGIQYALNTRSGNTLFGDAMGLGKTIEALGLINCLPDVRTVLVICPASVKQHWQRETEKWLVRPSLVTQWVNKDAVRPFLAPDGGIAVHIANWDIIAHRKQREEDDPAAREDFVALQPDVLILDESHKIKNPKAKRTQAVLEVAATAKRILALTGTPITNRPEEIWTTIHLLDPLEWSSDRYFLKRYCAAHSQQVSQSKSVWVTDGASNLEEFQDKLRASVMVRRLKEEVLTELPPKRRQIIDLDAAKYGAVLDREKSVLSKGKSAIEETKARLATLNKAENEEEYREAVNNLRVAFTAAFSEIAKIRHETALAKVQDVVKFAEDALESEPKIIVFAHHHDVIDAIAHLLREYGVVTLTGRDNQTKRNEAIDTFQEDPAVRVFIGSTLAAGMGITLTAASTEIFAELDWVPANLSQAEDRAHRIGQSNAVSVYHLVIDGSIDSHMAKVILRKQEIIDAALDDHTGDLQITVAEVLDITPPKEDVNVYPFPEAENRFLHHCLRDLSARCDGALALDGEGFNKIDARIGHSLAAADAPLSNKQVAVALRMANFYRRQFSEEDQGDIATVYDRWTAHQQGETDG